MSNRPELVIGVVAPVGVDMVLLCSSVKEILKGFGYETEDVKLSGLLKRAATSWVEPSAPESYDKRIERLQDIGYKFRTVGTTKALAIAALVDIRERRKNRSGNPDQPADGVAYLLNQLKHPDEVKLFREVYGSSFVLIAAHARANARIERLTRLIADTENRSGQPADAERVRILIERDEEEVKKRNSRADPYGQNTRGTYPLADLFVNLDQEANAPVRIRRFLDLLFGHPFHTPSPEEFAMHHAAADSLRSSDESRQVGAVIVNVQKDNNNKTSNIEIISTGMNEVPRRGGGFYWDGSNDSPDGRDQFLANRQEDRALSIKKDMLAELLETLRDQKWLAAEADARQTPYLVNKLLEDPLKGTQFMNISEFQRPVHAEMAAIIDSARRGVAVAGKEIFVTTFPCHNCAKHIIAAGIVKVTYLEPYPKSRAGALHKEEIELNPGEGTQLGDKVIFAPYAGIAPRQYERLFSMAGRGRKTFLSLSQWVNQRPTLSPQHLLKNAVASYSQNERSELANLGTDIFTWDPAAVCPESK